MESLESKIQTLWSAEKPFATPADAARQEIETLSKDGYTRLSNVVEPGYFFLPASGAGPHPAVLVCPGGGYSHLAWTHEGLDIAKMLNLAGFSAFVLKYRCSEDRNRDAARADAARAMRMIRFNAQKYDILPDKLGAIGFSAGGHLSAVLSASALAEPYPAADEIDKLSYRPDFTALIYPAYLADEQMNLAPEFKVTAETPSTFLVQAEDDFVQVRNSLVWYYALKQAEVPAEMHLYAEGGHGYGIMRTGKPVSHWDKLAIDWFQRQAGL